MKILVGYPCGVLFGGNANNGANAGLAYANSNATPSNANANISSHLYFLKNKKDIDLASWQKINSLKKGVGSESECSQKGKQI